MNKGKFERLLRKEVKGSAMYIALMVSVAIGVFLILFILISQYNQRSVTIFTQTSQLYQNITSGLQIAQSKYFSTHTNKKWFKNSINDDSIKIEKSNWGAYILIKVDTKNRHESITKSGLFGTFLKADTGMVISENGRAIGMSGKVKLMANCYISKAGIQPTSIEGNFYQGGPENLMHKKISPSKISDIEESYIKELEVQVNNFQINSGTPDLSVAQNRINPFHKKTIELEINKRTLSNITLKDNIKIVAQNLIIENTCELDNILIICKKIKFKEGFKGTVHVIASDSIMTEKNCTFSYPSSFILLAPKIASPWLKYIGINEGCVFNGGIIAYRRGSDENSGKVFIKLNSKSEVNGLIYSSDYTHVEGIINGTLYSNKLLIKTPSAAYENSILGCEINPRKYSHIIAVPCFSNNSKLICCQKL